MDNTQLTDAIRDLAKLIKDKQGLYSEFSTNSKSNKNPRDDSDRKFEASVKKFSAQQQDLGFTMKAFPKNLRKLLQQSTNDHTRANAKNIKTFQDILKLEDQTVAMQKIADRLKAFGEKDKSERTSKSAVNEEFEKISDIARSSGLDLKKFGLSVKHWALGNEYFLNKRESVEKKMREAAKANTQALNKNTQEIEDHAARVSHASDKITRFGSALKKLTGDFLKHGEAEARFAMHAATADAGLYDGVVKLGVSQLEYMKSLKETRVVNLAAKTAGVNFTASLVESQNSLKGFTTNSEEALKVSSMFHNSMSKMGVSQDQMGDAVRQQTDIYTKNYRALGYSAEQYAQLSESLINEQGMRDTLVNLQEKERKSYILGIQQRMAEYQTMGYTIERAKELQKTFQSLNAMSPKERMKASAKKRAMMGAMGMGAEGEELFNLEMRYKTMGAEEKLVAEKRMAEIQKQASAKLGERTGSGAGIGESMAYQMMAQKTGMDKVAQVFEAETGKGMVIATQHLKVTSEIPELLKKGFHVLDTWRAAQQSATTSLLTNLPAALALGLGLSMRGILGGALSKIFKIGKGGGAAFQGTKKPGLMSKMAGGAVKAGGAVAGAASAGAGKIAGIAGKSGLKSAIKKIPIIGALAGLGFGLTRAASGDWVGAAMEVSSGVASIFPGVGTAASLGIDAALMARDISGASAAASTDAVKPQINSMTPVDSENRLVSVLTDLQSYIKEISGENMELAASVNNAAIALEKSMRGSGFKAR